MAKQHKKQTEIHVDLSALAEALQQSDQLLQQFMDECPFDLNGLTVAELRLVGDYLLANANKVPNIYGI